MTGRVVLVGAGPGDPELITLRGARVLAEADVIVYDRLVAPALLDLAPPGAERIYVGKEPGRAPVPQPEIERLLVDRALDGAIVVRLKGGDPFVFGRGGEELAACAAAGVPCEVVPGVSAAVAAPAAAGIPVTHRGMARSFAVVTGSTTHDDEVDLSRSRAPTRSWCSWRPAASPGRARTSSRPVAPLRSRRPSSNGRGPRISARWPERWRTCRSSPRRRTSAPRDPRGRLGGGFGGLARSRGDPARRRRQSRPASCHAP